MTTKYEPKAGDRVRVVLEGLVEHVGTDGFALLGAGAGDEEYGNYIQNWGSQVISVELITPPLPTTPGSVLLWRRTAWLLDDDGVWRDSCTEQDCELGDSVDPAECDVIFDAGKTS